MQFFLFDLMSKFPIVFLREKKYFKLHTIAALRGRLSSPIRPSAVRISVINELVYQEKIAYSDLKNRNNNIYYFNFWLDLERFDGIDGKFKIEFKIFGIFWTFKEFPVVIKSVPADDIYLASDSYICPSSLSKELNLSNSITEKIGRMGSVVRSVRLSDQIKNIKKILVLRLDQMGDFILTLPAIIRLKEIFGEAQISVMVSPANEELARSLDIFSKIIVVPFSFDQGSNFRKLSNEAIAYVQNSVSSENFDLAVDFSPMPESRELLKFVAANYKVGFENTESSMLDLGISINSKDPINLLSNISHASYPLIITESIGCALNLNIKHIPLSESKAEILDKIGLIAQDYVVIHSGARNILVRWPIEKFVNLALEISKQKHKVIFFSDETISGYLRQNLEIDHNIILFEGHMEFNKFDAIVSFSKIFIGNDTGPKHFAALRSVPVISIHSPRTNWNEWGQVDSGLVISRRVPCAGCAILTADECGKDLICVKSIKVSEVLFSYNKLLQSLS